MEKSLIALITIFIVTVLVAGRIIYVQSNRETFQANHPFTNIERSFEWLELVISKEIEIPKAINLEVFKGLKPGLTIGEYNWLLGKPHNTSIDDEGVNVYEFRKPFGIIKVKKGYHRYEEGTMQVENISIAPIGRLSIEEIFGSEISQIISNSQEIKNISVYNENKRGGYYGIHFFLNNNHSIDKILWNL